MEKTYASGYPYMTRWAENEVKIACQRENPDKKDGEWDYGCACYESALKAYKSLVEDGHNGFSMALMASILRRLIHHKPLTPIEDTEDTWYEDRIDISGRRGEKANYQCKRMSSLFKYVYANGSVVYHDVGRVLKVITDKDGKEHYWHSGFTDNIVDELFPITMPYMPEDEKYKVYCNDFLYDKESGGDFDTTAVFFVITPNGTRIDINQFFAEIDGKFERISEEAYLKREEASRR